MDLLQTAGGELSVYSGAQSVPLTLTLKPF